LPAAYLRCREREITDTLVDLPIATVHRINARAETKVVAELKRVAGDTLPPAPGRWRGTAASACFDRVHTG
jgi:hypothetical protein